MFSQNHLNILFLSSGEAELYVLRGRKLALVATGQDLYEPSQLQHYARHVGTSPWVILVDQAEETYWGKQMPAIKGRAREVWLDKLTQEHSAGSPLRWVEVQHRSSKEPDKIRALGSTLGQSSMIMNWVSQIGGMNGNVRGVYTPSILAVWLCSILKLNTQHEVVVVVTQQRIGMRQTVIIDGFVRFSRLAVVDSARSEHNAKQTWTMRLQEEIDKLSDYLLTNGVIKNRVRFKVYFFAPSFELMGQGEHDGQVSESQSVLLGVGQTEHTYTRLQTQTLLKKLGIKAPEGMSQSSDQCYMWLLANHQPKAQFAPWAIVQADWSLRVARQIKQWGVLIAGLGLLAGLWGLERYWSADNQKDQAQRQMQSLTQDQRKAGEQLTQMLAQTTVADVQTLKDVEAGWKQIEQDVQGNKELRGAWAHLGSVLQQHPDIKLEAMEWVKADSKAAQLLAKKEIRKDAAPVPSATPVGKSADRPYQTLLVKLQLGGEAALQRRSAQDAALGLQKAMEASGVWRCEIRLMPFDLQADKSLSGIGAEPMLVVQQKLEVLLWRQPQ
jgi:hypothetical protein